MIEATRTTVIGFSGALVLIFVAGIVMFFNTGVPEGQAELPVVQPAMVHLSVEDAWEERVLVRGPWTPHQDMPDEVRAVYMSACYGSSKSLRNKLISVIEDTELNSIVIDIKDYTGTIAIPTSSPILENGQTGSGCKIRDIKELIELLHSKGIFVIGRITVFQDPLYAKFYPELAVHKESDRTAVWKDYKGLSFIDVGAEQYWDYIVELSKESYAIGFDELNFDYVRYPSDGPMKDIYFSHSGGSRNVVDRSTELEKFFIHLHTALSKRDSWGRRPVLSADLFGMTATNYDDLTIGQVLEKALPYFDAIAPMVYPSHYPTGFLGFANVNDHSYEIVNYSMEKAVKRTLATSTKIASEAYERIMQKEGEATNTKVLYKKPAYSTNKMRPWLQDFDYGGDYDVPEVNAQIKASRDAGVTGGYMLWSPSNRYTAGVNY